MSTTEHPPLHLTRATIIIAFFSLLSKLTGLLKFNILTSRFRVGETLDIYFAAFRVPDFFFNLLILGTLSAAFIPIFCEYLVADEARANRLAATVFNLTALVMGSLSVLLILLAPQLVRWIVPGFPPEKQAATALLTRIMSLSPLLFSLSSILSGILNSYRRFTLVALAPIVYNLSIIFGAVALYPAIGISGLAWGVVLGAALHFGIQILPVWRLGFRFLPRIEWRLPGVAKMARLFFPRVLTMDPSQVSLLFSTVFGSVLASGSVSVYNLAYDLQAVPLSIIGVSFATVAFPVLAQAHARGDMVAFSRTFNSHVSQIVYLIIPLSVLLLILRAHLVRLIFGHGVFDWPATILTIEAFGLFTVSLSMQCLIPLFTRAFFAIQNTLLPLLIGLCTIVINALAAYVFTQVYHLGVAGLALALSIAAFCNLSLLSFGLMLKVGAIIHATLVYKIQKIIAAAIFMGIVTYSMLFIIAPFVDTRTVIGLLVQSGLAALAGVGAYVGLTFLLSVTESQHLVAVAKLWLNKVRSAFLKSPESF